jgi:DNA-directed RNA polymerase specialized sigma24 family protein
MPDGGSMTRCIEALKRGDREAAEQCRRLLGLLTDESLRILARLKLVACTNAEIAVELGCIEATVERKVQRVRALWAQQVAN